NNSVAVGYDNVGEITSWSAQEANGSLRLNEQLGFNYDPGANVGYRTNVALLQTFTNNPLNQVTNVSRTGTLTVSGALPAPATNVTVNGLTAERYADFTFARTNISLIDGNNTFGIAATNVYGTNWSSVAPSSYLPASVSLQWDADGDLRSDGTRW